MSEDCPSVFLSCSFHERDRDVVDWFRRQLESHGFSTHIARAPTADPIGKKILAQIQSKDLFVAIITAPSAPWIHNEIGMAFSLGKPIVAFFEEGIHGKGIYPYIGEYVEFTRDDLGSASVAVHQKISAVDRKHRESIWPPSRYDIYPVQLITQKELNGLLPAELTRADSVDLCVYTAETFLNEVYHDALMNNKDLKMRILISRLSDRDPKRALSKASLTFLKELRHPGIEVREYPSPPLLRSIILDGSRGYIGLYRWEENERIPFIGAENNALALVTHEDLFGRLWLRLYSSRFEFTWHNGSSLVGHSDDG